MIRPLLLLLLLTSCATTMKDLAEDYTTIQGHLVGPPVWQAQQDRLILYLEVEGDIITAVAENHDEETVLVNLRDLLVAAGHERTVYLYGKHVDSWHEYVDGIDFEFIAAGVYSPPTDSYTVVLANYGTGMFDALQSVEWGNFAQQIGKSALKSAF